METFKIKIYIQLICTDDLVEAVVEVKAKSPKDAMKIAEGYPYFNNFR